jgi:glucose dehydrogenase
VISTPSVFQTLNRDACDARNLHIDMMTRGLFRIAAAALILGDCRAADQVQWPSVGGDWGNARYSTLSRVNVNTVKTLGATWSVQLGPAGTTSAIVVVHNHYS